MHNGIPPSISNNNVLKQIQAKHMVLAPNVPLLRRAYLDYRTQKGKPATLLPIGLEDKVNDALYEIYSGETKKYGVTWIGEYRSAPEQIYCPLCGAPNPSQLEHYLPRAYYPEFTILSWNLVPTCAVCNPKRGHHAHTPTETLPLVHPYYERNLLMQPLFNARIIGPFSAVRFAPITCPGPFSRVIIERLERQINLCFDKDKFTRWLTKLWNQEHAKLSGDESQTETIKKIAREVKIHRATTGMNSWDTIFYRSLLMNDDAIRWLRETPSPIGAD